MTYAITITVPLAWDEALRRTKEALQEQGFGILSEIDVRATFTAKLGQDSGDELGDLVILGACNPGLASRALRAEPDLGLLLPCNVVVRRGPGADATVVQAIAPKTMVQLTGNPSVAEVADDAEARLTRALQSLEAAAA
jgi:uncharacterized protein (DUF302 family)